MKKIMTWHDNKVKKYYPLSTVPSYTFHPLFSFSFPLNFPFPLFTLTTPLNPLFPLFLFLLFPPPPPPLPLSSHLFSSLSPFTFSLLNLLSPLSLLPFFSFSLTPSPLPSPPSHLLHIGHLRPRSEEVVSAFVFVGPEHEVGPGGGGHGLRRGALDPRGALLGPGGGEVEGRRRGGGGASCRASSRRTLSPGAALDAADAPDARGAFVGAAGDVGPDGGARAVRRGLQEGG